MKSKILNLFAFLALLLAGHAQAAQSVTFYHHDALGSVIAKSDSDGYLYLNEEYQPYGEKIYAAEDFFGGSDDWYTGKNYSEELDLTYFGARWYDAKQGRFLSMDPVGVDFSAIHSFNRYHYANSNPYKFIDPDGEEVIVPNGVVLQPNVLKAFQKFNTYIGESHDIHILGGDRDKNSKLGAGSNSQHVKKTAADFYIPGTTHLESANAAIDSGLFSGVGWYEEGYRGPNGEGPHAHADLRIDRTPLNPAKWGFRSGYNTPMEALPKFEGVPTLEVNKGKALIKKELTSDEES